MGWYDRHILPLLIDRLMDRDEYGEERARLLKDVRGDVLEIGFGTGLNLPHYPDRVRRITAVDANAGMKGRAEKRIRASAIDVDNRYLDGERMPMEDAFFDSVVCTWTLCSIPDAGRALRECRRVLRPGGRFFFVEHGLAEDPAVQKWQHRLTPIQKFLGGGCRLNRPIDEMIRREGFRFEFMERFEHRGSPPLARHHYRGVATTA